MTSFNLQRVYPNNGFRSYWKFLRRQTQMPGQKWYARWLREFQTGFILVGQILRDAGIELFFLLIFWFIITKMGQGRDLIVSLFEADGIYGPFRIVYTLLTVISFSVSMWIIPAFVFQMRDNKKSRYRSIFKQHLFFLHRLLPLIPFWLMAFVLFNGEGIAWLFFSLSLLQIGLLFIFYNIVKPAHRIIWYIILLSILTATLVIFFSSLYQQTYLPAKVFLAIILYLLAFAMNFIYHEVDVQILREHSRQSHLSQRPFRKYHINSLFYLACIIAHGIIVTYLFSSRNLLNIAPESMLLYIFSLYVFIIDLFVYFVNVSVVRKLIATLVVLALVVLYFFKENLNLTHYTMDPIADTATVLKNRERLTFKDRYADLKNRILAHKGADPYPIILISGEGGGSRAGMWLSQNLINFDLKTNGRFRNYIFSISTVSGSSVGLGTLFSFWEESAKTGLLQKWDSLPSKVYANNFVGGSISGLLLTDLWKSLLPLKEWVGDRNSTLQDEEAYSTHLASMEIREGRNIKDDDTILDRKHWLLAKDFMGFFYDRESGNFRSDRPLVFINTCRSNDGRRGIFSPIQLGPDVFNDAIDIAAYLYEDYVCDEKGRTLCVSNKRNISLGQACNTSELFPLFSAPAYIDSLGSFVDGGYHENSGLKTTLDIYQKLSDTLSRDKEVSNYKIYILYLKNGSAEKDLYKPVPSRIPLTLPFKALFSQPFEGSASYFEERAKYVDTRNRNVQYIEVKLNHRLFVQDSSIKSNDSIMQKQILRDLISSKDTTKKDTVLNFPLARWLSKSVIKRMYQDARAHVSGPSRNYPLHLLINSINSITDATKAPIDSTTKLADRKIAADFSEPNTSLAKTKH